MENSNAMQAVLSSNDAQRYRTDKHHSLFFFCVCICWIIFWIITLRPHDKDTGPFANRTLHSTLHLFDQIDYKDREVPWNISDCSSYYQNSTLTSHKTKPTNDIANKRNYGDVGLITFIHFIFHAFTFDPTYFGDCLDPWYPINFLSTGAISILFLLVAISCVICDEKMLNKQPSVMVSAFLCIVIIEHSTEILIGFIFPTLWPYDERLMYWVIPESVVFIIFQLKIIFTIVRKVHKNSHSNSVIQNGSSVHDLNSNNDRKDRTSYKIIPFHYYIYAMIFGFSYAIILKFLVMSTMAAFNIVGWGGSNFLMMVIFTFFIGRTIYHLGLMLTSYATNISIDSENFGLEDLKRAVFVVTKYHFGTACYHAIPSILRPESVFGLSEYGISESSDPTKYRAMISKLYEYYNLSRVLTAVRGYNHSRAIEVLLRLIIHTPMHEYFSSFGKNTFYLYSLLLPTNFLTHVLFWFYGFFDANLAEASWAMYITITLTFYLVMPFFKAASDVVGLRMYEERVNRRL